ncbi:hypothetical protein DPEC_G00311060 [Dallia pectoralis]|uniref:Uncharacterized protein n=1 Tax=Dallia pectoralis TaxID=75939 RepID=A0ACC2FB71_DALPE|nr:hypothetical protein DPEC_G00311060 [Dallia pectoralis]
MVVEALKLTRTEVSGLAGGVEYRAYEVNFHKEADKEATKRRIVEAGQTSPHNLFDVTDLSSVEDVAVKGFLAGWLERRVGGLLGPGKVFKEHGGGGSEAHTDGGLRPSRGVEYQAYEVNFHKEADKEATKRRIVEAGQTSPHNLFDATDLSSWKGGLEDCWDREKFSRSMVVEALKLTRTEVSGLAGGVEYQAYEVNFHKEADKEATKRRIVEAGQTSPHNLFDVTDLKRDWHLVRDCPKRRRSYAEAVGGAATENEERAGPSTKRPAEGDGGTMAGSSGEEGEGGPAEDAAMEEGERGQEQVWKVVKRRKGKRSQEAGKAPEEEKVAGSRETEGTGEEEGVGTSRETEGKGKGKGKAPKVVPVAKVPEKEVEEVVEVVADTPPEERPLSMGVFEEALVGLRELSEGLSGGLVGVSVSSPVAASGGLLPPGQQGDPMGSLDTGRKRSKIDGGRVSPETVAGGERSAKRVSEIGALGAGADVPFSDSGGGTERAMADDDGME